MEEWKGELMGGVQVRRKQKARTELLRQVLALPRAPSRERGDRW